MAGGRSSPTPSAASSQGGSQKRLSFTRRLSQKITGKKYTEFPRFHFEFTVIKAVNIPTQSKSQKGVYVNWRRGTKGGSSSKAILGDGLAAWPYEVFEVDTLLEPAGKKTFKSKVITLTLEKDAGIQSSDGRQAIRSKRVPIGMTEIDLCAIVTGPEDNVSDFPLTFVDGAPKPKAGAVPAITIGWVWSNADDIEPTPGMSRPDSFISPAPVSTLPTAPSGSPPKQSPKPPGEMHLSVPGHHSKQAPQNKHLHTQPPALSVVSTDGSAPPSPSSMPGSPYYNKAYPGSPHNRKHRGGDRNANDDGNHPRNPYSLPPRTQDRVTTPGGSHQAGQSGPKVLVAAPSPHDTDADGDDERDGARSPVDSDYNSGLDGEMPKCDTAQEYNREGMRLYTEGEIDLAAMCFEKAVQLLPKYSDALNNYGLICEQVYHDMERAEEFYKRAINADATNEDAIYNYNTIAKSAYKKFDATDFLS
eukprot:GFYU01008649.1.p1 GENE.GFYU01008649.1~~GFYU01008649.1.p1  ORF type:complete len:474 (-),score=76.00 GFYU01008649.1:107-1528(-)